MNRDDAADPPLIVCMVGSTKLTYLARAIDDLDAWLKAQADCERGRQGHRGVELDASQATPCPGTHGQGV